MTTSSKPLRPPQNRARSAARSLFTAGTVTLFLISGTAGALAQPTTTPAPTPSAAPDAVPAQRSPAPVDTCATPTTTAPTTTTTAPPTSTTTVAPAPSCATVPALPPTSATAPAPTSSSPAPAPAPAPAAEPSLAEAPLPAAPAADQPIEPENDDLSSKTAEPDPDWTPTENPNATVVPGEMRSDREEIPAPFTKEDADKAETMEARQRMSRAAVGCQTYWPSPYEVCGVIRDKYNSLGGPGSFLSFPNSPEYTNPDGFGKRTQFLNGPIYWSSATGAHPVVNSFLNRWSVYQYEAGSLKYPTTDEIVLPDGGRRQEFQQGAIYVAFQNAIGAAIFNGPLRDKYNSVGGLAPANTLLGYPTQDQVGLPDGQGQMDRFQNGVIYWSPNGGAHPVTGGLLTKWAYSAYEIGSWGYPIGDATVNGANSSQPFEFGVMTWPQQNIADAAVVDDGDIAPYVDGQAPTTAAAYIADSKEGVFADAIMIAGGIGATSAGPAIDDAELEEPTLDEPSGNTDEWIDPICFDRSKVPANNKWYYGRKFACLVSTEPMSVGYGTSAGTMSVTITTGVRSSHKTGGFLQEYQIDYGPVIGNVGTPVIKYKVTGSGFTELNHRYSGPNKREPVFSGQSDKIQLYVDQRSMSDLAVQTRSTKLTVSFGNNTPGYRETNTREVSMTTLRCDNTIRGSGGYRQGCVYPAKTPGWNMDANLYTQAVGHVQDALAAGVPGGVLNPLHREANVKLRSDNRNKACPTRGPISDGRRNGISGRSCDEYPFASTKEGAAQSTGGPRTNNPPCHIPDVTTPGTGCSVCMINASQNNLAGSYLGSFYGSNRVIDNDAFYVRAAGGTLP